METLTKSDFQNVSTSYLLLFFLQRLELPWPPDGVENKKMRKIVKMHRTPSFFIIFPNPYFSLNRKFLLWSLSRISSVMPKKFLHERNIRYTGQIRISSLEVEKTEFFIRRDIEFLPFSTFFFLPLFFLIMVAFQKRNIAN